MAAVEVREVVDLERDWPALKALFVALHAYHRDLSIPDLVADWEERWHRLLAEGGPDALLLVAERDGEIVGFAHAQIRRRPALFDEEIGYLNDMYVVEDARRAGVGSAMLAGVERWCRSHDVRRLELSVVAGNETAAAAYERWGFRPRSYRLAKRLKP